MNGNRSRWNSPAVEAGCGDDAVFGENVWHGATFYDAGRKWHFADGTYGKNVKHKNCGDMTLINRIFPMNPILQFVPQRLNNSCGTPS